MVSMIIAIWAVTERPKLLIHNWNADLLGNKKLAGLKACAQSVHIIWRYCSK